MMTKNDLEQIRSSLRMCCDYYYVGAKHYAYHECCDSEVEYTCGEPNLDGHTEDCHLMKSIKLIECELSKLEKQQEINENKI